MDSGPLLHTVYWARKRAPQCRYSVNLSLQLESFTLYWKGVRGLPWQHLFFHLSQLHQFWPPPSIPIVHLGGGNDLGSVHTLDLLFMIKRDLYRFYLTSPGTIIVFLEIVPRFAWMFSLFHSVLEKMRKRVNL